MSKKNTNPLDESKNETRLDTAVNNNGETEKKATPAEIIAENKVLKQKIEQEQNKQISKIAAENAELKAELEKLKKENLDKEQLLKKIDERINTNVKEKKEPVDLSFLGKLR